MAMLNNQMVNQHAFSDFWSVQARIQVMPPATPPRQKHRAVMPLGRPSATGKQRGSNGDVKQEKNIPSGYLA